MTTMDLLMAEALDAVRVSREALESQEKFLEQLTASREALESQEKFLEQLTASREGLLIQKQLQMLVTAFRDSLMRQEQLCEKLMGSLTEGISFAWRPPETSVPASKVLSVNKLRQVDQPTGAPDILVRLKRSWIGCFYQKHLKQIPLVRWSIIWVWRNLFPLYITIGSRLGAREAKRWRPLVKLGDFVNKSHLPTTLVFDVARVDTPVPRVFPVEDQAYLVPPHDHYEFPPVFVAEIGDALVYGGTNFVFAQDSAICHDLYDFARDYTSEELHGRHVIDAKRMRMRLLRYDATPEKFAVAANFVDACASNYAHWLTEVLPRIAAFCTVEQFANVPILVNDGLHRNIMESLALMVGPEREIITLPVGRGVLVDRLYVTSVAGYVPFERRDSTLENHSHGLFCPAAIQVIRDHFSSINDGLLTQEWPRKIYLRRTAGARKVTNSIEIEQVLLENGYVVVEPEKLTFEQQVALFSNAEDVVGSSGAALANLIFAPPTTGVHILIGKLEGTSYWYWQNIACSSGKIIDYILGTPFSQASGVHSDIYIEIKLFKSMLFKRK